MSSASKSSTLTNSDHIGRVVCLLLLARHMAVYYPDTHAQVPKRVPTCNHLPLVALDAAALMRAERRGFFVLAPASLAGHCACSHASAVSSCVWVSSSSPACAPPRLVCAFLLSPSLLPRSPGSRSQGYSTRSAPHTGDLETMNAGGRTHCHPMASSGPPRNLMPQ